MSNNYWVKLYIEILNDPKMGRLSDHQFRRAIEFILLAGDYNQAGLLPPVEDIAWRLRATPEEIEGDLAGLAPSGIVAQTDNGWVVVNFAKRQEAIPAHERKRAFRERERNAQYYGNEPRDDNGTETRRNVPKKFAESESESEKIRGEEEEEGSPRIPEDELWTNQLPAPAPPAPVFSDFDTANARSEWGNERPRDSERAYQQITGQISIPSSQRDRVIETLGNILDHYGGSVENAVQDGKPIYVAWCNTRGKNGRPYSTINPGWLDKWIERLASRPPPDTVNTYLQRMQQDMQRFRTDT